MGPIYGHRFRIPAALCVPSQGCIHFYPIMASRCMGRTPSAGSMIPTFTAQGRPSCKCARSGFGQLRRHRAGDQCWAGSFGHLWRLWAGDQLWAGSLHPAGSQRHCCEHKCGFQHRGFQHRVRQQREQCCRRGKQRLRQCLRQQLRRLQRRPQLRPLRRVSAWNAGQSCSSTVYPSLSPSSGL